MGLRIQKANFLIIPQSSVSKHQNQKRQEKTKTTKEKYNMSYKTHSRVSTIGTRLRVL